MIYAGLRASELRGLTRVNLTLSGASPAVTVTQRADGYQQLGPPKSRQSRRTIPLGPETVQARLSLCHRCATESAEFISSQAKSMNCTDRHHRLFSRFWRNKKAANRLG
ncbi:hypothetical protein WCLP8_4000038 [uncultured Gammaproteobacteria bacterium]